MNKKSITKHISRNCKQKFVGRKCNLNQEWNKDKCQCERKDPIKKLCISKRLYLES